MMEVRKHTRSTPESAAATDRDRASAAPDHEGQDHAQNRKEDGREQEFRPEGEIVVPEEQRPQHAFLRAGLDPVYPPAAGEGEVLLDIQVGAVQLRRPAVVQDRPTDVLLQEIGVGQVVIEFGVVDPALVDDLLVEQNRFVVKRLGRIGIVGGVGPLERGVGLLEQGVKLLAAERGCGLGCLASQAQCQEHKHREHKTNGRNV